MNQSLCIKSCDPGDELSLQVKAFVGGASLISDPVWLQRKIFCVQVIHQAVQDVDKE
jgi:hypothetical protein